MVFSEGYLLLMVLICLVLTTYLSLLLYKENAREYCLLKTEKFGTILMMEVGAMMVGKISNLQKKTATVKKGQEKGNFEFGGSTVILLLQPGKVRIDYDLLDNTEEGYETIVKMGERIGECKKVKKALRFVKNS